MMEKAKLKGIRFLVVTMIVLLLSGAVLPGLAGDALEADRFTFGEDTLDSITAVVGQRDRTGSGSASGQDFEMQSYSYKSSTVRDDMAAYMDYLVEKEFTLAGGAPSDEPGSGRLFGPSATHDARLRVDLSWTETNYDIVVTKQINLEKSRIDYELLAQGWDLMDAEAYDEALAVFEEAIAAHPYVPVYYLEHGRTLYRLGRPEESVESFNKALTMDVNNWEHYAERGVSYYVLDRKEEALADLMTAVRLGPADIWTYSNLAFVQTELGAPEDALSTCALGLAAYPDNDSLLFTLGETQLLLGNYGEALAAYDRMIECGYCAAENLGEHYAEAKEKAGGGHGE